MDMGEDKLELFSAANVDAVRIDGPDDVRRAAEALQRIVGSIAPMRVAPAHDIAGKRTPVDAEGNILARDVFGWNAEDKVWWKNSRIALDSPLTSACRFESEPFWVNADGFRTRQPNPYLDAIDLHNFEARAMTRAARSGYDSPRMARQSAVEKCGQDSGT